MESSVFTVICCVVCIFIIISMMIVDWSNLSYPTEDVQEVESDPVFPTSSHTIVHGSYTEHRSYDLRPGSWEWYEWCNKYPTHGAGYIKDYESEQSLIEKYRS